MSKAEPTIQKYMTCNPETAEASLSLEEALKLMADKGFRHLPVTKEGALFGVVSDRDIQSALNVVGASKQGMTLGDVCHGYPYRVSPDAKLHEVADEMAVHHYHSVMVVQNEKLVGIFTTMDVCRAFSDILQHRFHEHL